jgi:drug/metabolite transporter (DMT)-like permease
MTIVDWLFILRIIPLMAAGFIATRKRDYVAVVICLLYICVTSVNYFWANPHINAVFSTPLVFATAWYIIKCNRKRRRR